MVESARAAVFRQFDVTNIFHCHEARKSFRPWAQKSACKSLNRNCGNKGDWFCRQDMFSLACLSFFLADGVRKILLPPSPGLTGRRWHCRCEASVASASNSSVSIERNSWSANIAVFPDLDIAKSGSRIGLLAIIVLDLQPALARRTDEPSEMGYVGPMWSDWTPLGHVKSGRMDMRPITYFGRPEHSPLRIQNAKARYDQRVPRIFAPSVGRQSDSSAVEIQRHSYLDHPNVSSSTRTDHRRAVRRRRAGQPIWHGHDWGSVQSRT